MSALRLLCQDLRSLGSPLEVAGRTRRTRRAWLHLSKGVSILMLGTPHLSRRASCVVLLQLQLRPRLLLQNGFDLVELFMK